MVSLAAAACAALRCGKPVSPGKPYGNPRRHARGNDAAYPHGDQSCDCCAQSDTGSTARLP